ncbi:AAA family ATPase [Actinoplanes sp. Pm04-4]|uniref:AAA family ATPase n=1 Tax=Paractinoplanes pyxinae TaxID=2997416 RepID=A0ABT4AY03_9ACTN|nr:AAA family ATPase [Actinoplanes pyxinae]MCY1139106.1 AAA family ATPase [Actinoplanes pyxinae]
MEGLVGRDAELDAVDTLLDEKTSRVVVFAGEPGIGKSRMLTELGARADARGMLVLSGSASEYERDLPFWLFVDALDEYLRATPPDGLDDDDLAEVLPSWRKAAPATGDPRYRAHRAIRHLLEVLARDKPVVLLLDDVHWADSASVELVCALLRRPPAAPVLLGLATRPRQTPSRLTADLGRAGSLVTRFDLGPLSRDDVRELLGPDGVALYEESGGNPFYLGQLARTGRRGAVAIADELALLDRGVRQVLEGAAVAGDPFLLELVATAADRSEPEVADALDVLLDRDLVRPTDAPRRFRFRHPLLRRAVYEAAPRAWRVGAHERLARALADRGVPPAGRAHHIVQAARPGDPDAVELLRKAGDDVVRRAPGEAARWYQHATDLQPGSPELWAALGSALGAAGHLEKAKDSLVRAIELMPPSAVTSRVTLIAACAGLEHTLGLHDAAHRRLTTALDRVGEAHPAEAATLMTAIAQDSLFRLEFTRAVDWSRQARDMAVRLGEPNGVAAAAMRLAFSAAFAGDTATAAEACAEAAALLDARADDELELSPEPIVAQLAAAEYLTGRLAKAGRHAERALAVARQHVPVMFWTGLVRAALGRLPDAAALLDEAVEIARASGNSSMLGWTLLARSSVAATCGEGALARTLAEESVEAHGPATNTFPGVWSRLALAVALVESGEAATAVVPELDRIPAPLRPMALDAAVRSDLAAGRAPRAEGLAVVALHQGRPREAAELALAAARHGTVVEVAAARFLAARALAEAGDTEAAVRLLRLVCETYERSGAPRRRAEAERLLRRLGHRQVHHRSAPRSGLATLTERELQIARLITDRRTNAEIAEELYLSRKTVESHVRNLFHKLSVSSRVEIARAVERHDRE